MFGQLCSILWEYLSVFKKGPVAFEMGGGDHQRSGQCGKTNAAACITDYYKE